MSAAFLEIRDVHERIGATPVLKGISLTLEKGGFLVLVGPSGCGKSTLLNTIAGLLPVTSGDILIDGQTVTHLAPSKRDIAMVFQSYALYPNMTVAQNIAFALEMRNVPKPEREAAVRAVAQTLQIEHLLDRRPAQLSGGQRQRVAMGRALVRKPRVFLFDEPLSNLDAKLRVEMRHEIKRLHQRTGNTIVYVTHDQIEAMTLATKIAVMRDGELQQVGTPDEIYNRPANLFVADFMGSPAMNLLTLRHVAGKGLVSKNGEDIAIALPRSARGAALSDGQEVILGIRPEAVTDTVITEQSAGTLAPLDVQIEVVEPTGSDLYAIARRGEVTLTARLRADAPAKPGETFRLTLDLDKAVLFDPVSKARI